MIEIPLSKTGVLSGKYIAIIDEIDADLGNFNWSVVKASKRDPIYAIRRPTISGKRINVKMHRVILERIIGRPLENGEYVDHINGNGLDNRRENLRIATNSQNQANRGLNRNNTTGYKGVVKKKNRYAAQINVHGVTRHIGYFKTAEDAYAAYCEKAKALFGEFANLE